MLYSIAIVLPHIMSSCVIVYVHVNCGYYMCVCVCVCVHVYQTRVNSLTLKFENVTAKATSDKACVLRCHGNKPNTPTCVCDI